MYDNFDDLYNETYHNFYNACDLKDLISSEPIPYKLDENLKSVGEYSNNSVSIKPSPLLDINNNINRVRSILYHELTHYYDDVMFRHVGYSEDDINVLMLTYSEIHAAHNSIFAFLNLKNLTINKRMDLNQVVYKNQRLSEFCASQIAYETTHMHNQLGFKYAMYFLGEKRAMYKIIKNVPAISNAYNLKHIPENIRTEISNIDKIINLNSYENIDVEQININKLKVDTILLRYAIENAKFSGIESIDNEIQKIINGLPNIDIF